MKLISLVLFVIALAGYSLVTGAMRIQGYLIGAYNNVGINSAEMADTINFLTLYRSKLKEPMTFEEFKNYERERLLDAVNKGIDNGCIDHIDCWENSIDEWYEPIDQGQEAITAWEGRNK